jgi:hypothetical protein
MGIKKQKSEILIEEWADGFSIVVDGERFHFDQEDGVKDLVKVFKRVVDEKKWTIKYEEAW